MGQTIELTGSNFGANTQVLFNTQDGIFVFGGVDVNIQSTKITGNTAVGEGGGAYLNASDVISSITFGTGEAALITGNIAPSDPNTHGI